MDIDKAKGQRAQSMNAVRMRINCNEPTYTTPDPNATPFSTNSTPLVICHGPDDSPAHCC